MDGETNGGQEATQGAQDASQQQGQEQQETQQGQSQVDNSSDYEKQIAERDEKIASLEAQVAEAARNAETAEQLRGEIAELKAQGESDRIDFKLQLAGVRNVKAARPGSPTRARLPTRARRSGTGARSRASPTMTTPRRRAKQCLATTSHSRATTPQSSTRCTRGRPSRACSTPAAVWSVPATTPRRSSSRRSPSPAWGDYTRNVGYKTGAITYEFETKTFNYDRGIRLFADVMEVEEAGVNDCFVEAGAELQRTQVAPEADAFTFAQIAGHTSVTVESESYVSADAEDILEDLRTVTSAMDENQVTLGSRILFITPTLKGVLDDFSYANPNRSNRVLERFSRIVEVPQVRFYTAIDLLSGDDDQFGYQKRAAEYELTADTDIVSGKTYYTRSGSGTSASPYVYTEVASPQKASLGSYYEMTTAPGLDINFMVVEKSAVIKFDKHVASRVFSPDELEALNSFMMKYRKYGIVELFDNKLDGVYVSASTE